VRLSDDGQTALEHTLFAEGWLGADGKAWGRPVGLLRLPDGSMLVGDDAANVVYRISYVGPLAPAPAPAADVASDPGAAAAPSP
jgi:glucose/arabinose dehydrogenase